MPVRFDCLPIMRSNGSTVSRGVRIADQASRGRTALAVRTMQLGQGDTVLEEVVEVRARPRRGEA
jgi:hypothetical protein